MQSEQENVMAQEVVSAGVLAARMCQKMGLTEAQAAEMLSEGLIESAEDSSPTASRTGLVNLLVIAIIRLAAQEKTLEDLAEKVENVRDLAREKGLMP